MTVTRAVLITLVLALFAPGAAYPTAVDKRESAENEAVDAREEVWVDASLFLSHWPILIPLHWPISIPL